MWDKLPYPEGYNRVSEAVYITYSNPFEVGWAGWYEQDGELIAFRDLESNLWFEK